MHISSFVFASGSKKLIDYSKINNLKVVARITDWEEKKEIWYIDFFFLFNREHRRNQAGHFFLSFVLYVHNWPPFTLNESTGHTNTHTPQAGSEMKTHTHKKVLLFPLSPLWKGTFLFLKYSTPLSLFHARTLKPSHLGQCAPRGSAVCHAIMGCCHVFGVRRRCTSSQFPW